MKLRCPQCDAVYSVPDEKLATGRGVRCGACRHEWRPASAAGSSLSSPNGGEAAPAPVDPAGGQPAYLAENDETPKPPAEPAAGRGRPSPPHRGSTRSATGLIAAWLVSFGVVLTALGVGYSNRAGIVAAWAPAGRLFDLPEPAGKTAAHPAPVAHAPAEETGHRQAH